MSNKKDNTFELKLLKIILWIYIILCLIIAGLNFGYASKAPKNVASMITWFWQFYENWIKTFFIITCSILTIRIVGKSQRTTMRKKNLVSLIIAALVVHIFTPFILNNHEIYFFAMPLPWTTTPLQLLDANSSFYLNQYPVIGSAGIFSALIFYVIISIVVFVGTLLFGRRWQCSMLCLFNGFASEVFAPAFPLIGIKKDVKLITIKIFEIIRWIFLIIALFFSIWWTLHLLDVPVFGNLNTLGKIETYKYLLGELLIAMFFWIAFTGRGYCYYCPLGTVLGIISKFAGQKISTNNTNCIQCNMCNKACPMAIDIKKEALIGAPVNELRCVGCGHCVDACPTGTLKYETKFLNRNN